MKTNDKKKEEDFSEAVKLDSDKSVKSDSEIIKKYMHDLAMKSVAVQAKKYGKKKFRDMGLKAGIVRRANAARKLREKMIADGEATEGLILK